MIEILDTTDATLVGGKFEGFMKFAGALKFGEYHGRQEFAIFSGHCERELPRFPNCEQCDSTSNIFMAKTQPVLEVYYTWYSRSMLLSNKYPCKICTTWWSRFVKGVWTCATRYWLVVKVTWDCEHVFMIKIKNGLVVPKGVKRKWTHLDSLKHICSTN